VCVCERERERSQRYGFRATRFAAEAADAPPPSQLRGALDRFAAFFYAPLLRAESCAREMQAVDSEFRRNLQETTS